MGGRVAPGSPSQSSRSARSISRSARLDADPLDRVVGVAQPGGVDQHDRARRRSPAALRSGRASCPAMAVTIARASPGERVDEARLAGVGRAGDDDPHAVAQPLDARRGEPVARSRRRAPRVAREASKSPPAILLVGIVDRDLGLGRQLEQPLPPSLDLPPQAALGAAQGRCGAALRSRPRAVRRALRPGSGRSGRWRSARRVNSPGSAAARRACAASAASTRDHRPAAMALIFNDIFAGRAVGTGEARTSAAVDQRAVAGSRSSRRLARRGVGEAPASAAAARAPRARWCGRPRSPREAGRSTARRSCRARARPAISRTDGPAHRRDVVPAVLDHLARRHRG